MNREDPRLKANRIGWADTEALRIDPRQVQRPTFTPHRAGPAPAPRPPWWQRLLFRR
jgi:hypothetical protein